MIGMWKGYYKKPLGNIKKLIEFQNFPLARYIENIDISILHINHNDGSLDYVSDNVQNVLGITRSAFLKNGVKPFINCLIVNHVSFIKVMSKLFLEIFKVWTVAELVNLRLSVVGLQVNHCEKGRISIIDNTIIDNNSSDNILPIKTIAFIQDITSLTKGENYWIRIWNTVNKEHFKVYHSNSDYNVVSDILTKREKEILFLIIEGKSANEISEILFISHTTVNNHRQKILDKFGVRDTTALVILAKLVSFHQW